MKSDILTPLQQEAVDRLEREGHRPKRKRQPDPGAKPPSGKQRELNGPTASPYAHTREMRRQYIKATAGLIRAFGWDCYLPFNVARPRW